MAFLRTRTPNKLKNLAFTVPATDLNQVTAAHVDHVRENRDFPESEQVMQKDRSKTGSISSKQSQIEALKLQMRRDEEQRLLDMELERLEAEELRLKTEKSKLKYLKERRSQEEELENLSMGSTNSFESELSCAKTIHSWNMKNEAERHHFHRKPEDELDDPEPMTAHTLAGLENVLHQAFKALSAQAVKDLPQFSGEIMDWPIFENEFYDSTEEFKLTDRENLRRLIKSLHGKAKEVVEPLLTSYEHVGQIMKLLKTNFGRTEWIVAHRLEMLRQLKLVEEGSIESFRDLYNVVIGTCITLKNSNADLYLKNPELVAHVAEKLPMFSRQMWTRHKAALLKDDVVVDLHVFSDWLEYEMQNQLAGMSPTFMTQKKRATVLNVELETCPLCRDSGHDSLNFCDKFKSMSIEQRRTAVMSLKACFRCLKPGHLRANCDGGTTCSLCKENHHTLVHQNYEEEETVHMQSYVTGPRKVLLRVGKVKIRVDDQIREISALFDEGSSLTMIDGKLARDLNVNGVVSPVTYCWTNGAKHREKDSKIVALDIAGSHHSGWLKMHNVRTINHLKLPEVKIDMNLMKELYPSMNMATLETILNTEPKMLIGSDNADLIVPLKTSQLAARGLQLTRCMLGSTVHGRIDYRL